jgi:hypothetical protein
MQQEREQLLCKQEADRALERDSENRWSYVLPKYLFLIMYYTRSDILRQCLTAACRGAGPDSDARSAAANRTAKPELLHIDMFEVHLHRHDAPGPRQPRSR